MNPAPFAPWISGGSKADPVTGDRDVFGLHGRSAEQRLAIDLLMDPTVGIVSLGDVSQSEPDDAGGAPRQRADDRLHRAHRARRVVAAVDVETERAPG